MQNLKCRKIRGSHHGRRANFLRKQAEVCVFRELLRSDWSLFYKHGVKKRRIACAFLKASYANECLCKCCFVLIYWTVWPCKQLGGKDNRWALLSLICLVHCAVCHTLAHFGITWERTKSKAEIRFPLSSSLMTMNFSFFAFGFNTFTSVIKFLW